MEGDLQRIVGRNLRAIRTQMGLSQAHFGARLGWHRTYVGSIERGERNVRLRTVERVSDLLGLAPWQLLSEDGALDPRARPPGPGRAPGRGRTPG